MTTTNKNHSVFFTICAKNFLAHAKVLYKSIKTNYPDARFFVVLCDKLDNLIDVSQEPFEFIYIEDINLPNLNDMADRYNITEFNTAIKPFAFLHLMKNYHFESVIYVDPDLLFVDKLVEVDALLNNGAEAILTPHILESAESSELDDRQFLLFGIYNLGFLALKQTPDVLKYLAWWSRRLEKDCVINLPEGIFVDQKWCDLLPAFVASTHILNHPGYNVAYWNLPQRTITKTNNRWFSNNLPLRFVHFSGNKVEDKKIFSRHSKQVTVDNIGDLKQLLDFYRNEVYAQGHDFYRNLPYAYNWNGASGVNLHTPDTLNKALSPKNNLNSVNTPKLPLTSKLASVANAFPVAKALSGGTIPLIKRAWRSYKANGFNHVKSIVLNLNKYSPPPSAKKPEVMKSSEINTTKNLLFIDYSLPKPDIDAASIYTFLQIKIFISEGYNVSFLPCSLQYEKNYYENLAAEGVTILCYPQVASIESWLIENVAQFGICVLSRGPVVWPYLSVIQKHAPKTKLIFNTIDLHFLRELRQAELLNNQKLKESSNKTFKQEFDLINSCDLTILLSKDEAYVVRKILPNAKITVLPLVFDNIPGASNESSFESRKDIVFVGSFPHLPNIDAIEYYLAEVHPIVKKLLPDVKVKIIGKNPPKHILDASINNSIEVLGYVQDLKPIYDNIKLSIAPLRFGAGIKGKIANSMCYGVPSVVTPVAAEGMDLKHNQHVLIAQTPEDFAQQIFNAYTDTQLWHKLSLNSINFANNNYSYQVIQARVKRLLWALNNDWKPVEAAYEIESWDAYLAHAERSKERYSEQVLIEQGALPTESSLLSFPTIGECAVCKCSTTYLTSFMYSTGNAPNGRVMPNWREHMQCFHCGLVNRVRASLHVLHTFAPPSIKSRIYITERVTRTYDWLNERFKNVMGSEYLGADIEPGAILNDIRHEDVMNLSIKDNSLDYVLSFDVLEHVPDSNKAFQEIFRALDIGGTFLFSVPFSYDSFDDIVRATLDANGNIRHHMPAEYHGNPVDHENGALCFRYFGWQMLDQLRDIGFLNVRAVAYWSKEQGYLGKEQFLFLAQK
jgi:glycosyltransferase involved in cell wall biosynthesis/SAM-dependent methyltransferase